MNPKAYPRSNLAETDARSSKRPGRLHLPIYMKRETTVFKNYTQYSILILIIQFGGITIHHNSHTAHTLFSLIGLYTYNSA